MRFARSISGWLIASTVYFGMALPAAADVLVFGGTRGVGLESARLIAAAGEPVTVLVRETSDVSALNEIDGVSLVYGDALVAVTVTAAYKSGDFDTVISTLSGSPKAGYAVDSDGSINAINGAKAAGAQRFILISSIGVGESAAALPQAALDALGTVLAEKAKAESYLIDSGLDYTIIRPGGLTDKPANGLGILTDDIKATGVISRAEVARLTVESINDPETVNKIYTAIESRAEAAAE